jgi:hypothetical protein
MFRKRPPLSHPPQRVDIFVTKERIRLSKSGKSFAEMERTAIDLCRRLLWILFMSSFVFLLLTFPTERFLVVGAHPYSHVTL